MLGTTYRAGACIIMSGQPLAREGRPPGLGLGGAL